MSRIISYRGLLADESIQTIPLHTNDGKTGYKVVKFQLMPNQPGATDGDHIVQIFKVPQTTTSALVNFPDTTLTAVCFYKADFNNTADYNTVIFDNEVFNQDIYVTHKNIDGSSSVNYYIELEQVNLTEDQALVAIVKNLRNEQ